MKNINLKAKIPGKAGAIARLTMLVLIAVIGILTSFGTIGHYIPKRGLWLAITDAFSGCGVIFLVGAFFWGFIKWLVFIAPKSFGVANSFWCGWIPLTFFGLYLKACIWLLIALVPCMIFGLLFSPLFSAALFLAENEGNLLLSVGCFLVGIVAIAGTGFLDAWKLIRSALAA